MPKISVIIPVYNVEKYLRQCLDSVINQTYKDLEIICVDDCSTDNSRQILQEYAKKDERIKILYNKKNSKLGPTRNNGLKVATGKYIHFLDSDDWLEPNAYETLINDAEKGYDAVYFLWNNVDIKNGAILPQNFKKSFSRAWVIEESGVNAWHGLYKKDFLSENNLEFNDYSCMEDLEFTYKAIIFSNNMCVLDKQLLNYRINNPNSLISKYHKFYYCALNSYNTIYEISKQLSENDRDEILSVMLNSVLYRVFGAFEKDFLNIYELKQIISNIDLNVFKKDKKYYQWYKYYEDFENLSPFMIKLKCRLKLFLREKVFFLYNYLRGFKN